MITSRSTFLRIRNVSDKSCRENQNTYFMFSNFFFENRPVYETKCKNIVQPGRPQMTIWCMHITRWINEVTDTHSEYVILIAFPLLQWLRERASMLRLYVHSPSCNTEGLSRLQNLVFYPTSESCSKRKHQNECVDWNTKPKADRENYTVRIVVIFTRLCTSFRLRWT